MIKTLFAHCSAIQRDFHLPGQLHRRAKRGERFILIRLFRKITWRPSMMPGDYGVADGSGVCEGVGVKAGRAGIVNSVTNTEPA